jgi:hypothetical protein
MNLELEGRVVQLLEEQKGEGKNGPWVKQEVIIETYEQYPRKICIACWGDKAATAKSLQMGDRVKAGINIESREFNSRWYTDIKAWRIDKVVSEQASTPQEATGTYEEPEQSSPEDDLPF